jgi:hypothetical protein
MIMTDLALKSPCLSGRFVVNPVLAVSVKNRLKLCDSGYEYYLKNIVINGAKRGCSGFVKNPKNGKIIYLTTEPIWSTDVRLMYRYAQDLKDWGGRNSVNNWADPKIFIMCIHKCLQ